MVIGGQAVLRYGEPRLTKDIDVTLGLGVDGFQTIREVARALDFVIIVERPEDFVRQFSRRIPAMTQPISTDGSRSLTPHSARLTWRHSRQSSRSWNRTR
jgi:hypothetical protein